MMRPYKISDTGPQPMTDDEFANWSNRVQEAYSKPCDTEALIAAIEEAAERAKQGRAEK